MDQRSEFGYISQFILQQVKGIFCHGNPLTVEVKTLVYNQTKSGVDGVQLCQCPMRVSAGSDAGVGQWPSKVSSTITQHTIIPTGATPTSEGKCFYGGLCSLSLNQAIYTLSLLYLVLYCLIFFYQALLSVYKRSYCFYCLT